MKPKKNPTAKAPTPESNPQTPKLSPKILARLAAITNRRQQELLRFALQNNIPIPEHVWQPIDHLGEKLDAFRQAVLEVCSRPDFRPRSYWDDEGQAIVGSHTTVRRPAYCDVGEFLPACGPTDVEIARISLASTLGDSISIRARRRASCIAYKVEAEYDLDFVCTPKTSREPLTHARMINLIETLDDQCNDGPWLQVLLHSYRSCPERLRGFVSIHSDFYPALRGHFQRRIDEWIAGMLPQSEQAKA